MRVRVDQDRDLSFGSQGQKTGRWVLLGTGLVPASGVDFEGFAGCGKSLDCGLVVAAKVSLGSESEFFHEIRVTVNLKKIGTDHSGIGSPIEVPNFG